MVLGLILALATAALVFVGSRPSLPAPFGLAGNGVVAYGDADGDLLVWDPVAGASRLLVGGPTRDETPWFSRDGSKIAFARAQPTGGLWTLMVANADGSDVRALTGPLDPQWNEWSPEGRRIAVLDAASVTPTLTIHHLDGTPPAILDVGGMKTDFVMWRPNGQELVFRGLKHGMYGLYALRLDGSAPHAILPATPNEGDWRDVHLSPDGTRIVYMKWVVDHPTIHIVAVDTGIDREVTYAGTVGANTDGWAIWSTDGTRLVFTRLHDEGNRVAVGSVDGGPVVELGPSFPNFTDGVMLDVSPDGSIVIAHYGFDQSTWLLDIDDGRQRQLPASTYLGSWQRLAP
jgi:hypothetical protein